MTTILQSSMGLLRSRLSRRIVSWVFFSIIVIEGVIFVPSYHRRYREKLKGLEDLSSEVLFTAKANAMLGRDRTVLLQTIQQNLKPNSVILGATLCMPDGAIIDSFGDLPEVDCREVPLGQVVRHLSQDQKSYDVAWPSDRLANQYVLVVRHDATGVKSEMRTYVLAIVGIVLIISAFVTLVTIVVLERILIIPILHLRDDLCRAGYAVSQDQQPDFQTRSIHRQDELGEVSMAFSDMFERVHQEIADRKEAETALKAEQEKSEKLLLNILPMAIAEQLKLEVGAIASRFEEATILFADIVDFTGLSAQVPPNELVCLLNDIFSAFDGIAEQLGLEKIKTIGDAYMVVGGLPNPRPDHAEAILKMAVKMLETIQSFQRSDGTPFQLRIGINTGPVVAGVIGIKKFSYDLWGDAVNIASRMESHGIENRIQVSESSYQLLKDQYMFEDRGDIQVKGRGQMHTYLYQEQPALQGEFATDEADIVKL
ncbi:MAG: adenylate/guanylate cyclase domain-containing protein [Leptolyngbya sp. SIO1E4]|nr:adenylate/guanylate cyclase domain-containing protein [Leptolyngbya sp. SIO1E4]